MKIFLYRNCTYYDSEITILITIFSQLHIFLPERQRPSAPALVHLHQAGEPEPVDQPGRRHADAQPPALLPPVQRVGGAGAGQNSL